MTLWEAKGKVVITGIPNHPNLVRFGLVPGAEVCAKRMGGVVLVKLGNQEIGVGLGVARGVEVCEIEDKYKLLQEMYEELEGDYELALEKCVGLQGIISLAKHDLDHRWEDYADCKRKVS